MKLALVNPIISLALFGSLAATSVMQLPASLRFEGDLSKSTVKNHNKTVVCMLDSWAHWRSGEGQFHLSNVDPELCTQLVYRNARLNNQTFQVTITDEQLALNLEWYRKIVALGNAYRHMKVFLSLGGWNEGSKTFSQISNDYNKREVFIDSVVRVLGKYGFHGLDLAWEYPTWYLTGGLPQDANNFPILIKELRDALGTQYLLSLTVTGDPSLARQAYKLKAIAHNVDQFNIRTFDYAGEWGKMAYHHSALKDTAPKESVEKTVNFYLSNGVPAEKLVVGVPVYGRTFILQQQPSQLAPKNAGASTAPSGDGKPRNVNITKISGLGEPTSGGFQGMWTPDPQSVGFHEICYNLTNSQNEWKTFRDNFRLVPFARKDRYWISFEDLESIELKVNFALEQNLKGIMAWTIDTDDFKGTACQRNEDDQVITYPVLRTINYATFNYEKENREVLVRTGENVSSTERIEEDLEETTKGQIIRLSKPVILSPQTSHDHDDEYGTKKRDRELMLVILITAMGLMVLQTIFTAATKQLYIHYK